MWRRQRTKEDFTDEIQAHIDLETDRLIDHGISPEDARSAAAKAFGNVTRVRERFYESRRFLWLDHLRQDLRYATRSLGRNPGFTLVAVLTLAIGIGGVAAIFSVVNGVLLRSLPYGEADRLVTVSSLYRGTADQPPPPPLPPGAIPDWQDQPNLFQEMLRYSDGEVTLLNESGPETLVAPRVSPNFAQVLEVEPLMGRGFVAEDAAYGPSVVAIVSNGFWKQRLGGRSDAIGAELRTSDGTLIVIGVMPPGFSFPPVYYGPGDIWIPAPPRVGRTIARLNPGASIESTARELDDFNKPLASPILGV